MENNKKYYKQNNQNALLVYDLSVAVPRLLCPKGFNVKYVSYINVYYYLKRAVLKH